MDVNLDYRTVGELLALVAHDLRNPLSALHSNLGFLKSVVPNDDPDAGEAIDDGVVSCDGLSHIIDNLDLFAHALRGMTEQGAQSDLVQVARAVVARSQKAAESHGLVLEWSEPNPPRLVVRASHELLERAIANLIRNGVQHGPPGSAVRISCLEAGSSAVIAVADEGATLGAGDQFFSAAGQVASKNVSNGRYSRGLGLYVAFLASLACGARLAARAGDRGSGNVFELSVPLASRLQDDG